MLLIPCGVFYDDFPMFSPSEIAEDAELAASALLDLLGCRHARTGPKGKPFSDNFQVLGCELDLRQVLDGKIVLKTNRGDLNASTANLRASRSWDK